MKRRMFVALLAALALPAVASSAGQGGAPAPDRITLEEFRKLLDGGQKVVVLDVRNEVESKIRGAKHIPLGDLEARLKELPAGREIVTYCA
ncbi:MAG TPA: rhodanese-like domain-containing protein [Pyrinomonadaceae bacterium]|nr:rhodanese-like domain-containing protein [Pyrinomonadaceae bacterium]